MTRVRIIGLKSNLEQTLETVQQFGRVHLEDARSCIESGELPISSMAISNETADEQTRLLDKLQRTRAITKGLYGDANIESLHETAEQEAEAVATNDELIERYSQILQTTGVGSEELVARREALSKEQATLDRYAPMLEKVEPMVTELVETHEDYEAIALIVENRYQPALDDLREVLTKVTKAKSVMIVEPKSEETVAAVIGYPKAKTKAVQEVVTDEYVNQIALPKKYKDVPLPEALSNMRDRIEIVPAELALVEKEIEQFGNKHRDTLTEMRDSLADRLGQLDLYETFGETEYTFVISGYVPTDDVTPLRKLLEERCGEDVVIEQIALEADVYDEVPVEIENPSRLKPFEAALGVWGMPRYGSIDPTSILSWSFPFIFGMIVSDFGYGSMIMLVCLLLRAKFPTNEAAKIYTGLMMPTAAMTMAFGVFTWELFGDLAILYVPGLRDMTPKYFSDSFSIPFIRTSAEMMPTYLLMALGAGVLHVLYGLVLGYISARRAGNVNTEREKLGLVMVTAGAILLVATMFIPPLANSGAAGVLKIVSYLIIAAGFGATLWGGGVMGAIEAIEMVSHMASYIRIMAVGLVGALLADAANKLAFVTMPNAIGAFIALVLHVLNFAIILFSPAIHALRLNFLEFFGKFFERGHVLYRPFTRSAEKGIS